MKGQSSVFFLSLYVYDFFFHIMRANKHTLRLAVSDSEAARARVGSVGASIVLDGAAPLQGGARVDKGVAIDGEGPAARSGAGDGRRRTAQRAGEGLDVGRAAGVLAGLQLGSGDGGVDLGDGGVGYEKVLGDDAARGVVGIVTSVALGSGVACLSRRCVNFPVLLCAFDVWEGSGDNDSTYATRSKGTGLNGQSRVSAEGGKLFGNV